MNCPSCGITNPDEQSFCGECGANPRETVQSLSERVAKLELRAKSDGHFVAQKNLWELLKLSDMDIAVVLGSSGR